MLAHRRVERVNDQRTLATAADAGHRAEDTERQSGIESFYVVAVYLLKVEPGFRCSAGGGCARCSSGLILSQFFRGQGFCT